MKKNDLLLQAMHYGLFLGAFEILKYLLSVISGGNNMLATLYVVAVVLTPFIAFQFAKKYRDSQEESATFGRLFGFTVNLFFFSALLTAVVQYTHWYYVDPNFLATQLESTKELLSGSTFFSGANLEESFNEAVSQQGVPSAISATMTAIYTSSMYGMLIALPIAGVLKATARK